MRSLIELVYIACNRDEQTVFF